MNISDFSGKTKRTETAVNNVEKKHRLTSTQIVIIGLAGLVVAGYGSYLMLKRKNGDKKQEKELDQREQMLELESIL